MQYSTWRQLQVENRKVAAMQAFAAKFKRADLAYSALLPFASQFATISESVMVVGEELPETTSTGGSGDNWGG